MVGDTKPLHLMLMWVGFVSACSLPEPDPPRVASWAVTCESWACYGADGRQWSESWVRCWWECVEEQGHPGQAVSLDVVRVGECWTVDVVTIEDGATCGAGW